MKQLRTILIPILLGYLTIVAGYFFYQRHLIFHPVPLNGTTPKQFGLTDYKDVSFPSADGITLTGWWVRHLGNNPDRPILLYCHGNGDCLSQLAEVSRLFFDYGFDALLFDYRDYGGSAKGPLSERALDADALGAYQWLKAQGTRNGHLLIWGHSLGSSVAAWLAVQVKPAGLILEGAFPSIYAVSRKRNPWLLIPSSMILDKFETEKYVAQRDCPLLELHAEKDTIIPLGLGQRVFESAAPPKQWLLVKDTNHNDFPSVAHQYQKTIMDFVDKCIKKNFVIQRQNTN